MTKFEKIVFYLLLVGFIYHTVRDGFHILNIRNPITDALHWPHQWCQPICDYVTFPPEIFGMIGSVVVINRNKVGMLGLFVLASTVFWPLALIVP